MQAEIQVLNSGLPTTVTDPTLCTRFKSATIWVRMVSANFAS